MSVLCRLMGTFQAKYQLPGDQCPARSRHLPTPPSHTSSSQATSSHISLRVGPFPTLLAERSPQAGPTGPLLPTHSSCQAALGPSSSICNFTFTPSPSSWPIEPWCSHKSLHRLGAQVCTYWVLSPARGTICSHSSSPTTACLMNTAFGGCQHPAQG